MLEEFLPVHLLAQVGQSVGPLVQIGLIDLEYVACEDHLGAFSRSGEVFISFGVRFWASSQMKKTLPRLRPLM